MRIRRVDAEDGGAVSVKSAISLAKPIKKHPGNRTAFLREAIPIYGKRGPNPLTRMAVDMSIRLAEHVVCVVSLPKKRAHS